MDGSSTRGPTGMGSTAGGPRARFHHPGASGVQMRFPTLEVFAALSGDALTGPQRRLTQRELDLARPIFADSIRYESVRLARASIANAPTTLGNFIRVSAAFWRGGLPDGTLIHELMHVWQFQCRGTRYVSNSLHHQVEAIVTTGDRNNAYNLNGAEVVRAGSIDRLPAEKQAVLVETCFHNGALNFPGDPAPQAVRDHEICQSMMEEIRRARPLSLDFIVEEAAFGSGRWRFEPGRMPDGSQEHPMIPLLRIEF